MTHHSTPRSRRTDHEYATTHRRSCHGSSAHGLRGRPRLQTSDRGIARRLFRYSRRQRRAHRTSHYRIRLVDAIWRYHAQRLGGGYNDEQHRSASSGGTDRSGPGGIRSSRFRSLSVNRSGRLQQPFTLQHAERASLTIGYANHFQFKSPGALHFFRTRFLGQVAPHHAVGSRPGPQYPVCPRRHCSEPGRHHHPGLFHFALLRCADRRDQGDVAVTG